MPNQERKRPYDIGRVFFSDKTDQNLKVIYFQPLGNHVGNVRKLVKAWKIDQFPGNSPQEQQASQKRVDQAAKIHDVAKPQKFRVGIKTDKKESQFIEYTYSFKGHRYEAESKCKWIQSLARGHHDFSVEDISRDIYQLQEQYSHILDRNPLAYAQELYILEMCDQIEAELACRVIEDNQQAESRAFMDYTTTRLDQLNYLIDPYPFEFPENSQSLSFVYWEMKVQKQDSNKIQEYIENKEFKKASYYLDEITKNWWREQQGEPPQEERSPYLITIKPHQSYHHQQDGQNSDWWYQNLAGFNPNPMQQEMFEKLTQNNSPAILLKAPTGVGKFEAILFPALAQKYRLILPLPARSLLEDQKQRTEAYLKIFSQLSPGQEVSLVVDTGSQMQRYVYRDGEEVELNINPRRHLYKGDVILTTLDKFLYRYFAYGDKQKSFIFPLRIHSSKKTLICFDEAHSYDDLSFTNFHSLVSSLYETGRNIVLMTATMPAAHVQRFDYLDLVDYINNQDQQQKLQKFQKQNLNQPYLHQISLGWKENIKCVEEDAEGKQNSTSFIDNFTNIIIEKWAEFHHQTKILAVVETVKNAVAIYQQIKEQLNGDTTTENRWLFLYHGRIADQARPEIYQKIKTLDDDNKPYIVVTTSAIEVGCDLNSQILISQICPPENLIQRVGRCNRKGNFDNAKVLVVGDRIPEFVNTLDEEEWQQYRSVLQKLAKFNAQEIGQCIKRSQHIDDYRLVELFSMLEAYVYQADLTCQPTHKKGLVITRSWTPSATLFYDDGSDGDWQKKISKLPKITVPLDRLIIKNKDHEDSNKFANLDVFERSYDQENTQWNWQNLGWGSAYQKDILIRIGKDNSEVTFGVGAPYEYNPELGFVELPGIFTHWSKGFEEKLLYQQNPNQSDSKVILTYIKALQDN